MADLNDLLKIEGRARKSGNLKTTNHIPSSGSGYGLQNGKRVYYRKGKIAPAPSAVVQDLLIENPKGIAKGLYKHSGLKSIVEEPGSLGIIDPRLWLAMGRTKRNINTVGRKQGEVNPKNPNLIWDLKSGGWVQNKAVTNQIAKNQTDRSKMNAAEFFGTGKYGDTKTRLENINAGIPENPNLFKGQMLISNGQLVQAGSPGFGLKIDKVSNQGSTSEVEVGNTNSQALTSGQATPKAPIVQEKETRQALRSDVFTLDENNVPLGVMTRAQRRAWDANPDNQKLMRRRKEELRIPSRTYSSGNIGTGSG